MTHQWDWIAVIMVGVAGACLGTLNGMLLLACRGAP